MQDSLTGREKDKFLAAGSKTSVVTTTVDSSGNVIDSFGSSLLANYVTQGLDDTTTSNVTYIGQVKNDGAWLIKKLDETSGMIFTFANLSNNTTKTTYTLAWADRATLVYENFNDLTF